MIEKVFDIYNDIITGDHLSMVKDKTTPDFEDFWKSMINPFNKSYKECVNKLFEEKLNDNRKDYQELANSDRAARMVTYYGLLLIDAIEDVWGDKLINELKEIDNLAEQIVNKMNEHMSKPSTNSGE